MSEQLKKYVEPVKNFWGELTKKKKIVLVSVLAGVILIAASAAFLMNRQPFVVLYPGLERQEAVEVMTELGNRGVSYKEDDGTIMVPKDQENALRMDLANMGYPKTAPNYDFFTTNTDVMTTDYEKKTIEKYQLNQRLEAVIKTLDGVKGSSVTISIPEQNSYAWDENSVAATASVAITMYDGKSLQAKQVNGIKQLVSKSVPNLEADNVAVIDTKTGEELSAEGTGNGNQVDISQFKRTIEKAYENDVESNVRKVLNPVFGINNVGVTVKSVVDVDKKIQEIITYHPSNDTTNTGVVSESIQVREQERADGATGGTAGAETNADVTTYPGVTVDGDTIYAKDEQSYKYLVSQVKEQVQNDAANIKDMTISVVINQEMMNDNQRDQIANLVAHAAAIDPAKVAVYNASFAEPATTPTDAPGLIPADMTRLLIYIAVGVGVFLLLTMILLAVVKSRKRKVVPAVAEDVPEEFYELTPIGEQEVEEEEAVVDPEAVARDEAKKAAEEALLRKKQALEELEKSRAAQTGKEEILREKLQDFAEQNPEIAAQLIRTWLRGEDFNGGD